VPQAVARLETIHGYDVPKIVVLDPEDVSPAYADWLRVSVERS